MKKTILGGVVSKVRENISALLNPNFGFSIRIQNEVLQAAERCEIAWKELDREFDKQSFIEKVRIRAKTTATSWYEAIRIEEEMELFSIGLYGVNNIGSISTSIVGSMEEVASSIERFAKAGMAIKDEGYIKAFHDKKRSQRKNWSKWKKRKSA